MVLAFAPAAAVEKSAAFATAALATAQKLQALPWTSGTPGTRGLLAMDQLSTTSLLPPRMLKLPQATAPAHIPKT